MSIKIFQAIAISTIVLIFIFGKGCDEECLNCSTCNNYENTTD